LTTTEGVDSASARPALRPLRVLMVSDWHAKYVTWLSRGLIEHGCRVRLLTRDHDLEFGGEAGEVEPGTMARWVTDTLEGRARHLQLPGRVREVAAMPAALRLWGGLRRFHADVVHLQDAAAQDFRLPLVAGILPRRYAVTIHDVHQHPGDQLRGNRTARVRRALIANAGLIFVHSEPLRELLLAGERPSAPVVVVPHGTNAPVAGPLPADPHVMFFGRISRYKGVDTLLDAMRVVWTRLPAARLTIAGYGELAPHPALDDRRVTVRNEYIPEDEMDALLGSPRCVVLPYIEASQSGVGSRAKAFGRPLVVTDVGGLPDLVADGSGKVVPPGEPAPLADALVDVLGGPGVAAEMSRRALATVAEISWERVAEMTIDAYSRHLLKAP
jgi:starch synthase